MSLFKRSEEQYEQPTLEYALDAMAWCLARHQWQTADAWARHAADMMLSWGL